ncbi:UDP-N-acetylmuramate dehydrogenase [Vibrio sp. JC009]|uniref:UDP-N-acetylmuramate dehydrogenase n=1 Tax=Vibrio sp. JC009 TaxID=2912314 RepID=UPI0023B097EF|nr:UDP-N-acetylmuramate dehydrogenase [Vibrio sp. JC009]WED21717.1 UDP-N-acetylmuramate dehydrogenase [Vibrio sp. JC009]
MQIYNNASLKPYHTFAIESTCEHLVIVESAEELVAVYQKPEWQLLPKLVLGKGSNMLFTEHFMGVVIINRILGKAVSQSDESYLLHIQGGEDWPELVKWATEQGYPGLENLALIPGCAGSAPIQNIGAYGIEFKDVCEYVDILDLDTFSVRRLTDTECLFGYRESVFKHELKGKIVITAVGLKLAKAWVPNVSYGSLQSIAENERSPKRIFDEVCQVRMAKLPDPEVSGNAGSFFKNPVITTEHFSKVKAQYPEIVAYPAGDKMKVAAGWLIDQCGFKGVTEGGAQVHPNQALVLVNKDNATAEDVVKLASRITTEVKHRYGIALEHEVRFMGATQETFLAELIQE